LVAVYSSWYVCCRFGLFSDRLNGSGGCYVFGTLDSLHDWRGGGKYLPRCVQFLRAEATFVELASLRISDNKDNPRYSVVTPLGIVERDRSKMLTKKYVPEVLTYIHSYDVKIKQIPIEIATQTACVKKWEDMTFELARF
jgi:hypothetical protein